MAVCAYLRIAQPSIIWRSFGATSVRHFQLGDRLLAPSITSTRGLHFTTATSTFGSPFRSVAICSKLSGELRCGRVHHGSHTMSSDCERQRSATTTGRSIAQIESSFRQVGPGGGFRLAINHRSGVATMCISNGGKKNCFTGEMMAQFGDQLDQLERWREGKALVIYGENGFFCSGGDLDTVRQIANQQGGDEMIRLMQHNLARLERLPLITVALVEGMALGGGAELITACDYRLASQNAEIGFVQVAVGITTVWGGGARLVSLIGYNRALRLIATGCKISATEAAQLGFIDQVLPSGPVATDHETAEQKATTWLAPFLARPRETMLVGKSVARAAQRSLDEALGDELRLGLQLWGGAHHAAALSGKVNHKRGQVRAPEDNADKSTK